MASNLANKEKEVYPFENDSLKHPTLAQKIQVFFLFKMNNQLNLNLFKLIKAYSNDFNSISD